MRKGYLKKFFFVYTLSLIFFFAAHNSLMAYEQEIINISDFVADKIANTDKKTIAVVDFTDLQGNVTELGRFLAEEFSVALAGAGKGFEVIDRTHLKSILEEHKLSLSGIMDPQTARKLGQIAGVDALITGSITPFGESVRVTVKVLDTETARMLAATRGNIAKTKAIEELLASGIDTSALTVRDATTTSSHSPDAKNSVETEGFIFRPVECKKSGSELICTISFQNLGNEQKELTVWGHGTPRNSYIYDNRGNRYPVEVQIGKERPYGALCDIFMPQLPVNIRFITKDVLPEATLITVVISIRNFEKLVSVTNIPITK